MDRKLKVKFYTSFEAENIAEHKRRAAMTPDECLRELAILQERRWGKKWTSEPIVKKVSFEKLEW